MKADEDYDPAVAHMEADALLLDYIGDHEITTAFQALTRYYS